MPSNVPTAGGSASGVQADDILYLDPLFDRLEAIERRLDLAAQTPPPLVAAPEPDLSPVYLQLQALRLELPGLVSNIVEERLAAAEAQSPSQAQPEAVDLGIRESVALAVSQRFGVLESALKDHAASITALHERVTQNDANLQRLVAVISRLIEGPGLQAANRQAATPQAATPHAPQAHAAASFEAHLSDALKTHAMNSTEDQAPDNLPRRRPPLSRII